MEDQLQEIIDEQEATVPALRLGSLPATSPAEVLEIASSIAKQLVPIIDKNHLFVTIGRKKYVMVEGWSVALALMGIIPQEESSREIEDGWEATSILVRTSDGATVGRGSAICTRKETLWRDRPAYALKSMASTRSVGKAARLGWSWLLAMSGYQPTPAEEMMDVSNGSNGNGATQATQATPPELVPFTAGNDLPDAPPSQKPRTTRKKVSSKPASKPASTTTLEVDGKVLKLDERSYMDKRSGESKPMFFVKMETDSGVEESFCLFSESVAADLSGWVNSNVHLSLDPPRSSNQKPTVRAASLIGVEADEIPTTVSLSDDDIPF